MTRVYEQIFDLCFYGQGGFNYSDVLAMPVNVRSYYYKKLAMVLEARQQHIDNQTNQSQQLGQFKR